MTAKKSVAKSAPKPAAPAPDFVAGVREGIARDRAEVAAKQADAERLQAAYQERQTETNLRNQAWLAGTPDKG